MTHNRFRIPLLVLVSLLPMGVSAQTVITFAPQVVGGLSSWTGDTRSSAPLFQTPYFSTLAGIKLSIWGLTGDTNLAVALGIGYDARGTGSYGQPNDFHQEYRLNYVDMDLSLRYRWLEAGVAFGLPRDGHLNLNISDPNPHLTEFSDAEMNKTFGIFAAANVAILKWLGGNLNAIARLDYVTTDVLTTRSNFIYTTEQSPDPLFMFTGGKGPIFMARLGLSYDFTFRILRSTP